MIFTGIDVAARAAATWLRSPQGRRTVSVAMHRLADVIGR